MWATIYFRELPVPIGELDENLLDFIFIFANTYTEESILHGYVRQKREEEKEVSDNVLEELGY